MKILQALILRLPMQLRFELGSDPDLVGIQVLQDRVDEIGMAEDIDEINELNELWEQIAVFPEEKRKQFKKLRERLWYLDETAIWRITSDDFESGKIMEAIHNAPQLQPVPKRAPPFADYKQNTAEAWSYVSDETIDQYFEGRRFVPVRPSTVDSDGNRVRQIDMTAFGEHAKPLEVPLDLIVDAAGFDSWRGRAGLGSYKVVEGEYSRAYGGGNIHSEDLIKHYASLTTELPSVTHINIYVQPDGVMFANNGEGDSHRIAAAILRGQQTIKTSLLTVIPIDTCPMKAQEV